MPFRSSTRQSDVFSGLLVGKHSGRSVWSHSLGIGVPQACARGPRRAIRRALARRGQYVVCRKAFREVVFTQRTPTQLGCSRRAACARRAAGGRDGVDPARAASPRGLTSAARDHRPKHRHAGRVGIPERRGRATSPRRVPPRAPAGAQGGRASRSGHRPRAEAHVQQPQPPGRGSDRHARHHGHVMEEMTERYSHVDRAEKLRAPPTRSSRSPASAPLCPRTTSPSPRLTHLHVGDQVGDSTK
jgi:hypothetical protein